MLFEDVNINYEWATGVTKAYFAQHLEHLLSPEKIDEAWDLIQKKKAAHYTNE